MESADDSYIMHELSSVKDLMAIVRTRCAEKNITRVDKVSAVVGSLTTYQKEAIIFYFDILKKDDSLLSAATLTVKEIPGRIRCRACKKENEICEAYALGCPSCGSVETEIIAGRDFSITGIEGT